MNLCDDDAWMSYYNEEHAAALDTPKAGRHQGIVSTRELNRSMGTLMSSAEGEGSGRDDGAAMLQSPWDTVRHPESGTKAAAAAALPDAAGDVFSCLSPIASMGINRGAGVAAVAARTSMGGDGASNRVQHPEPLQANAASAPTTSDGLAPLVDAVKAVQSLLQHMSQVIVPPTSCLSVSQGFNTCLGILRSGSDAVAAPAGVSEATWRRLRETTREMSSESHSVEELRECARALSLVLAEEKHLLHDVAPPPPKPPVTASAGGEGEGVAAGGGGGGGREYMRVADGRPAGVLARLGVQQEDISNITPAGRMGSAQPDQVMSAVKDIARVES
jgi:hypothetical protein